MARKRKNLTIEEELMELEKELTGCEDEIKRLTERKKELKQIFEQKQTEALYQAVIRSGKDIGEVIDWINSESHGEQQEGK